MNAINAEYWFNAHETASLAAEVEGRGFEYYCWLSSVENNPAVRDMCLFFAEQEKEHKKVFQDIASHYRLVQVGFAYSIDIRSMMNSSFGRIVSLFSAREGEGLSRLNMYDCLHLALQIEKTSVAVYRSMRENYTERFSAVISRIVAEEEEHLRMVSNVLKKI